MKNRLLLSLLASLMCSLFVACGSEPRGVAVEKPVVVAGQQAVHLSINLEKEYVRSHSSIQYALQGITPFTNNAVNLYGVDTQTNEAFVWRQPLQWGVNQFWVIVPENHQHELRLRIGGTREGLTVIGSIDGKQPNVRVFLSEAGVNLGSGL